MRKLLDEGLSLYRASKILAERAEEQIGEKIFSANAISSRYRHHTGKRNPHPKSCHRDKSKKESSEQVADPCSLPVGQVQLKLPLGADAEGDGPARENISSQIKEQEADHIAEGQKAADGTQLRQESKLKMAEQAIRRAAHLLQMIAAGQIEDNGTEEDRLSMEAIKGHGRDILASYVSLDVDIFKVHEFYSGWQDGLSQAVIELKDFHSSESSLAVQDPPHQRVPDSLL